MYINSPIGQQFHTDFMKALGIDLGGTNVKAAFVDKNGHLSHKTVVPSDGWTTPDEVVDGLAHVVSQLLAHETEVSAIGLGMPGPLNTKEGYVLSTPNMPFKEKFPIRQRLREVLNRELYVQNDANCAALGEAVYGAAKNSKVSILLTLGTGVGGGIVIDGGIFDGVSGYGGEIGHIPLYPGDTHTTCAMGHIGCLEAYVQRNAVKKLGLTLLGEEISPRVIEDKARQGNKAALDVYLKVGEHLGVAVATLVSIFNPDSILIGGGMSPAFDLFEERLREVAARHTYSLLLDNVIIQQAKLGNEAGIIGAACYALQEKGKSS